MAERISEEQVGRLVAVLRSDAAVDAKVQIINSVKSGIKQQNVPEASIATLFDALRLAATSQHAPLVNAGFTALNHLLTRLSRQEPKLLAREAARTLPIVAEKLGDQREKLRALASQALDTLHDAASADVERVVRITAMSGKSVRAKEAGMSWLLHMHQDRGLQFRGYVPVLMELLEDADPGVREVAKTTVVDLFRNAPSAAKSDLKRQLKNFKVRGAIEQAIVKELTPASSSSAGAGTGAGAGAPAPSSVPSSAPSSAPLSALSRPASPSSNARPASRLNLAASVSSLPGDRPITPAPGTEPRAEPVEPMYVDTARELDDIIKAMQPHFEGRETEQNWLEREKGTGLLRRIIAGNATSDMTELLVAGLRSLLDGIIKAVSSLRTSLSKEGCALVQDMAVALGPAIDPMVELLMQALIKLSGGTKKIIAQLANTTLDTIVANVTYTNRIMQHIWGAAQDKNVAPRMFASGWLTTLLRKQAGHKSHFEHTGGLDLVDKSIRKGLNDPNPGVREKTRRTFWMYAGMWPARTEAIMADLEPTAQKLLMKDPGNPNGAKADTDPRPGLGLSKSTNGPKPSVREAMMAQKKAALAARNPPPRPGSAMSRFSPARTVSGSSVTTSATFSSSATHAPVAARTRHEPTVAVSAGGMSVAPMRPSRKRAEMAPRPATAGPYSVRPHDVPSAGPASPDEHRARTGGTATPRPLDVSPRRTVVKARPGHAPHASESSIPSPTKGNMAKTVSSPRGPAPKSPARLRLSQSVLMPSSPSRHDDEDAAATAPKMTYLSAAPPEVPTHRVKPGRKPEQGESATMPKMLPESALVPVADVPIPKAVVEPEPISGPANVPMPAPVIESEREPASEPESEPESKPVSKPESKLESEPEPIPEPKPNMEREPLSSTPEGTPQKLKIYEDPIPADPTTQKPTFTGPVLEDKPVNEVAANVGRAVLNGETNGVVPSPDKSRQAARLLDSGIARIRARTLDAHGFRKLQSLIRDMTSSSPYVAAPSSPTNKLPLLTDDRFGLLARGLFAYLEDPLPSLPAEKALDLRAQVLTTIRALLRRDRSAFQPLVSVGLESLLAARAWCEARTHVISGLELLALELVGLGDPAEMVCAIAARLGAVPDTTTDGSRCLGTGLHILRDVVETRGARGERGGSEREGYVPNDEEMALLAGLAGRCLESTDSGVRMEAVGLCVAVHAGVGDKRFWGAMRGLGEDPKSLITYYIVKRQREGSVS